MLWEDTTWHVKLLWYKTWPRFKLWLAENYHYHNVGDQAFPEEKHSLWVMRKFKNPRTKMFGETNNMFYSQFQPVVDIIMEMVKMLLDLTNTEICQLYTPPRLPCWNVSMVHHRKTTTLCSIRNYMYLSGRHTLLKKIHLCLQLWCNLM